MNQPGLFIEPMENVYRLAQIAITATRLVASSQIEERLSPQSVFQSSHTIRMERHFYRQFPMFYEASQAIFRRSATPFEIAYLTKRKSLDRLKTRQAGYTLKLFILIKPP